MSELVDQGIRDAAYAFLRGDTSVPGFTFAFRDATSTVTQTRPLSGAEVELFLTLEKWEESGWDDRAAAVDELRRVARKATGLT